MSEFPTLIRDSVDFTAYPWDYIARAQADRNPSKRPGSRIAGYLAGITQQPNDITSYEIATSVSAGHPTLMTLHSKKRCGNQPATIPPPSAEIESVLGWTRGSEVVVKGHASWNNNQDIDPKRIERTLKLSSTALAVSIAMTYLQPPSDDQPTDGTLWLPPSYRYADTIDSVSGACFKKSDHSLQVGQTMFTQLVMPLSVAERLTNQTIVHLNQ